MSLNENNATAGQGPVDRPVRPAAWWHKAQNGNFVCWTSAHAESLRLAAEVGFDLAPLYDQAALDAAVAAERERFVDALADACMAAEIPDSKFESLLIALRA